MDSIFSLHVCCSDSAADKARPHLALAGTELCLSEWWRSGPRRAPSPYLPRCVRQPGQTLPYCSDSPAAAWEIAKVQRPWNPGDKPLSIQLLDLFSCFQLHWVKSAQPFPSWLDPSFFPFPSSVACCGTKSSTAVSVYWLCVSPLWSFTIASSWTGSVSIL